MPEKIVEIPGVGNVSFPDAMSDDDIGKVISQQQAPKPQGKVREALGKAGSFASNAFKIPSVHEFAYPLEGKPGFEKLQDLEDMSLPSNIAMTMGALPSPVPAAAVPKIVPAFKAGARAAAPQVAAGTALSGAGFGIGSSIPGVGEYARWLMAYPGVKMVGKGFEKGFKAFGKEMESVPGFEPPVEPFKVNPNIARKYARTTSSGPTTPKSRAKPTKYNPPKLGPEADPRVNALEGEEAGVGTETKTDKPFGSEKGAVTLGGKVEPFKPSSGEGTLKPINPRNIPPEFSERPAIKHAERMPDLSPKTIGHIEDALKESTGQGEEIIVPEYKQKLFSLKKGNDITAVDSIGREVHRLPEEPLSYTREREQYEKQNVPPEERTAKKPLSEKEVESFHAEPRTAKANRYREKLKSSGLTKEDATKTSKEAWRSAAKSFNEYEPSEKTIAEILRGWKE